MEVQTKNCQNCKQDFIIEPEDFNFYKKISVPSPTFCPECREQRRLSFRNEANFYKRNCDLCGVSAVSRVSPDKEYKMYCSKCWLGDSWDFYSYGKEYDFSRSFFEQFKELLFSVPHISLSNSNCVDSEWVNQETDDKNCYLNIGGLYNEDSAYNTYEVYGKNCFDNYFVLHCDHCSNNTHCDRCYQTHYCDECYDSMDTLFSFDCRNCNNIIGCAGLRNKQYCIFNEQHTKETYENFLKEHPVSSYKSLMWWKEKSKEIWLKSPHRENFIFRSVNSTGNNLDECKNAKNCWEGVKIEDSKNMSIAGWLRDCQDCSCYGAAELGYECAHGGGSYNSKFLLFCLSNDPLKKMTINSVQYSAFTTSSSNCFGCVGVRNGEYVILNKRYTKEQYEELLPKIIQHMTDMPYFDKKGIVYKYGEFFPSEISFFGYNETTAMEHFPLSKEQALEGNFVWSDYTSDTKYEFSDYEIPDDIKDVKDDILQKILKCTITGKAYKIIPIELSFYRKMGLPIPRVCPKERHQIRIGSLLPRKLFNRNCDFCKKKITTPYDPKRPELVYCESCYQKEVL